MCVEREERERRERRERVFMCECVCVNACLYMLGMRAIFGLFGCYDNGHLESRGREIDAPASPTLSGCMALL